jgi:hypothetical protein
MNENVAAKTGYLVLHMQFPAFQFQKLKVVCGGVGLRFTYLLFERFVTFLKFRKMRFNRHVSCLLASLIPALMILLHATRNKLSLLLGLRKSPFYTGRKTHGISTRRACRHRPKGDNREEFTGVYNRL